MLIPSIPELSEEIKRELWQITSVLQLIYLILLASFLAVGSLNAVWLGGQFLRTGSVDQGIQGFVFFVAVYVAARAFRDEVRIDVEEETGAE